MTQRSRLSIPGIYTITHIASGKVYVGQTNNIRERWMNHRRALRDNCHRNYLLQFAWNKYGSDGFEFAVYLNLSHIPASILTAALNDAERAAMAAFPKAYNLMEVGEAGGLANEATRQIWSDQRKKMWADPEFRARRSAATKALHADPIWKARRAAAIREGLGTEAAKAKRSALAKAMWADPEFKAKMAASKRANWKDPTYRLTQSASREASWADPESRARRLAGLRAAAAKPEVLEARKEGQLTVRTQMAASHREKWKDPAYRERQSASRAIGQAARFTDPEERERHRQRMREAWARRKAKD